MKSAASAIAATFAALFLTTTASAAVASVNAPLFCRTIPFISSAVIQADLSSELAAVNNSGGTLGPAQFQSNRSPHKVRTLTVSTTSLSFGTVSLNTVSSQSITLTSTGSTAVSVSALAVTGAGFSVAGPALPLTLSSGQSATVQVRFDPTVSGAATGALAISSNSSTGSTTNVSLSGTGATGNPILTLSATSLNFGSATVGTPITQSVRLTSTGTTAVTVNAASVQGAGFTISGATFPVTLNPTIAITVQVQFDPTVTGTATGTLTFTSNSSTGSSSVVMLSGSGTAVQHQVSLTWAAPASSPVPITGYNIHRAAAGSTSFQVVNASADTQTSYVDQNVQTGSSYSYYVTSLDSTGVESTPSNTVSLTIP